MPDRFVGAWRRRGLTIGGEPRDDADVLWLQAGSWYADLRIPHADPGGPVEAFAGPAAWAAPHFTWWHELDWVGSFPEDVGHLEEMGADLVERGTFTIDGAVVPYHETWVRSSAPTPRLVAVGEGPRGRACVVRVADHAIGLADARRHGGGFAAWRAERRTDGWRTVFQRSIDEAPWSRIPLDHPWVAGERIEAGVWSLSVREAVDGPDGDFEG